MLTSTNPQTIDPKSVSTMALQHQSEESNERPVADARVTPEEFADAVAAIEARRLAHQEALAKTVPVAETIEELALEVTPAEVLAEVEARRQAVAPVSTAPKGNARPLIPLAVVAVAGVMFFSVLFKPHHTAVLHSGPSLVQVQSIAAGSHGPVKIKCGGERAISPFIADTDFSGGRATTNYAGAVDTGSVVNPAPQSVYQAERYGNMTYAMPGFISGAPYIVRLHFCENYFKSAGKRVFNVTLNNKPVLQNFDIVATAGAEHRANIQQFTAHADDNGEIVLNFTNVVNEPLINAIDVHPSKASANP